MVKNLCRILATTLILTAVYQVFTLGYGCSSEIEYQTDKVIATNKHYADEHLSVIYERRIDSKTDFVHLQVDTTYHEIGKGGYRYEVLCKREYNLRSFDNGYDDMQDVVAACFISGKEWELDDARRKIIDYSCQRATAKIGNQLYEAWYTDALPHRHPDSREIDDKRGLILEARDAEGSYELRAKYIREQIG